MKPLRNLFILLFLASATNLNAQLYEIPLDVKIAKSSLIVEGEVIRTQAYQENNIIYTANLLEVRQILKGAAKPIEYVTVVTLGGIYEGTETTWTHLLQLHAGQEGIFFLQPTNRPEIKDKLFPAPCFEAYSSGQGFLRYIEKGRDVLVRDFVNVYPSPGRVLQYIQEETGEIPLLVKDERERCAIISLEPSDIPLSFEEIGVDVTIRSQEEGLKLYKSSVIVKYDTEFFGSNIVMNGLLTYEEAGLSLSEAYTLSASDLAEDVLELKLEFSGVPDELFTLTEEKALLGSFTINLTSPIGEPGVSFDYELMEEENQYYDIEADKGIPFKCVEVENEIFPVACPKIDDFFPKIAAAGVGEFSTNGIPGVITIVGSNFGSPPAGSTIQKPANFRVGFRNAGEGNFYVYPPERDYIKWTPDTIVVRIPSVGETGNAIEYAGTGEIVVVKTDEPDCLDISDVELYVPFCVQNAALSFNSGTSFKSIPIKLADVNTEGGYDVFLEDDFVNSITGGKEAFIRALRAWQCDPQYGVNINFVVKKLDDIVNFNTVCYVSFDSSIPAGVTVTVAVTTTDDLDCSNTNHTFLPRWDMKFNKYYTDSIGTPIEIQWHTDSIPLPPGQDTLPNLNLEGVALHEIGHALLLRHVRNDDKVMKLGDHRTTLTLDDSNGGAHIVKLSISQPHCQTVMEEHNCTTNAINEALEFYYELHPNPVNDVLNIDLKAPLRGEIHILNSLGQLVYKQSVDNPQREVRVNVAHLVSGIYFFVLYEEGQTSIASTIKIIKL